MHSKQTILIVDDDADFAEAVASFLEANGYHVLQARNGSDGLKVAKAEDPYVKEFRHFANVILGEEAPRISGEDGRRTLEVALAIQRSGETGQPVRLA